MFGPMSPQTEYARFNAETHDHERRAEHLMHAQLAPSISLLNELTRLFTEWALKRREPADPQIVSDLPPRQVTESF